MRPSAENCALRLYCPDLKGQWDDFVRMAKNGSFLFLRDYMEYHSDRFVDHSLMFYLDKKLVGCLPANLVGRTLHSHRGLTYGGLVMHPDIRSPTVFSIIARLALHLRERGFEGLVYNPMPHIYHRLPAEEDLEAITRLGGQIVCTNAISVVRTGDHRDLFSENRCRDLASFRKSGLVLGRSYDFEGFMTLCTLHLSRRFSSKPVHTASEMQALASLFPDHIQLYAVLDRSQMVAGLIFYRNEGCAKLQYIAYDELGKKVGAVTALFAYFVDKILPPNTWLELGHSVGGSGQFNEGVYAYKESLGARAIQTRSYLLAADLSGPSA